MKWRNVWEKRIVNAIETAPNLPWKEIKSATSIFNNITIELSKFMWYKHKQYDDITLVVIHYKWDQIIENDFSKEIDKKILLQNGIGKIQKILNF